MWNIKIAIIALITTICCLPIMLIGGIVFMDAIDDTTFPSYIATTYTYNNNVFSVNDTDLTHAQQGILLTESIAQRLKYEMDETLWGWSVNDSFLSPAAYMDNRANRQRGVLYATKELMKFHVTNFARLNDDKKLNRYLVDTYSKDFNWEGVWGLIMYYDESYYDDGFDHMEQYYTNLMTENDGVTALDEIAEYNPQTIDLYNALRFLTNDTMLGKAKSELQGENIPFTAQDDSVYYAQGIVLECRNYLNALVLLNPQIIKGEAGKNLDEAYVEMDKICSYDPVVIWDVFHDRAYLHNVVVKIITAINNVAQEHRT